MALTLPLHILASAHQCYCSNFAGTSKLSDQIIQLIIDRSSIFDIIKWQQISKSFQRAVQKRLEMYTMIDIKVYNNLQQLRHQIGSQSEYDWHPSLPLMIMKLEPNHLGIAIDSELKTNNVTALLHLVFTLRHKIEQLFIDSPIIELLVAQINREQINMLIEMISLSRKMNYCYDGDSDNGNDDDADDGNNDDDDDDDDDDDCNNNDDNNRCIKRNRQLKQTSLHRMYLPNAPFFPNLKKLSIISKANQLQHLSRLLGYAVSVDLLYHVDQMDVLCLKILIGNIWAQSTKQFRLFRHLTSFRKWIEADILGVRYFQQFGIIRKRSRFLSNYA